MNGFLFIDKEEGWTSRDVCNKIQHLLNIKKVGHLGTLDPFATGLLIVTIGSATKTSFLFDDEYKEYIALLKLGNKTSTGDKDGEIISSSDIPKINKEQIINVLHSFIGDYNQTPPMTSAIHKNGVKLYELAHKGIEIDREPRRVNIKSCELISFNNKDEIIFKCCVSKGTYIRVLGEDIAAKLNSFGYLEALQRTGIGQFNLSKSIKISDVDKSKIIPIHEALSFIDSYHVNGPVVDKIKNGLTLTLDNLSNQSKIIMYDLNNNPLAIYQYIGKHTYKCLRGLWNENN